MPNYRRAIVPGGVFFFTVVTHRRRCILADELGRECLRRAIAETQAEHSFEMEAVVLLPDHLHCIWRLPENDADFSKRWGQIKSRFTRLWTRAGGREAAVSQTRREHRERGIWQKRFWEHRIRDEGDLIRHVNYIHFNPVKHGLARCPHEWQYSSFSRWVRGGYYNEDWLCDCDGRKAVVPKDLLAEQVYGE
ncbi:MAG: transposase [Sedimentisphaerales bacterium]|nr:transposase [Sedimentisphaerales bacterium]